jgi:membrane protein
MATRDTDHARTALIGAGLTGLLIALGLRRRPAVTPSDARGGAPGPRATGTYPDDGRGRHAEAPSQIPSRGWWDVLRRTAREAQADRILSEAAGVTFFALLAIFPALAALVSLYGLFADPTTVERHLEAIAGFVPGGGMEIIREQLHRVAEKGGGTLGFSFALGLAISLWSANAAMKALFDTLNVVYEEREKRGFLRLTATTLLFTLGALLFVLLAIAGVVVLPVVLGFVGLGGWAEWLPRVLRWPLLMLALGFGLALIYRYGPSRRPAKWRWVSWGSVVAAVVWVAGSLAFSWYVENFGSYNETYGSLGAAIGFMTWIWLSSAVVLIGAELNAELEHQTARDTTTRPEKPLGRRGARMADTVAPRGP